MDVADRALAKLRRARRAGFLRSALFGVAIVAAVWGVALIGEFFFDAVDERRELAEELARLCATIPAAVTGRAGEAYRSVCEENANETFRRALAMAIQIEQSHDPRRGYEGLSEWYGRPSR